MYLRTWLGAFCLSALFSASAVAATAEQGNQDQCAADLFGADSVCGVPGAWTAVGRMPAARIVIFDPVSNSFAYVACGRAPKDPRTISNQDYLDRRRLALSTQKIRLLILPYNPADGDLGLEVHHGEGVEFAEIAGIDFPESTPAATTPTPKGKTPQEEEEEKNTREGAEASTELANDAVSAVEGVAGRVQDLEEQIRPVAGEEMPDSREAQGELLEERSSELRQFIPDKAEPLKRTRDTLAVIAWTARDYQRQLEEISRDRQSLRNALQCVSRALTRIPQAVSQQLATGSPHFTLERDVLLCEVRDEARRRTGLITKDYYSPCLNAGPGFEGDMQELENRLSQLRERLDFAGRTLAEIPAVLPELYGSPSPDPKVYSPRAWAQEVAEFRDNVATLREVQDELEQQLDDLELEIQELRDDHDLFLAGLSSPAMQLQRFNFSPLGNKKSITFTIRRGVAREEDGGSGAIPARVNSLELKSAPVYSVQFGMGLVATGLESPTFKVANVPAAAGGEGSDEGGEGEGNEPRQILLYDDRGDGKVLPGLFIHHHWLRRSPLLRPTWFELFTPTFSLGIPVAEAEALQQIFLGLNWELVTGMDVNVGYHFGRVKSLAQGSGIRVGEPLPPGFDMSSAQRDDFDSAFYFGIVLNSEAFKFLTNGAED